MQATTKSILGVVVLILVVGLGWWATAHRAPTETGPIRIGVSIPLTGEVASVGEQIQTGLEFAVKEVNGAGGVNGRPIELVYGDDKCDATGATVFQKLTSVDNVVAIIGPLCSASASAGLPIAQTAGVPTLMWASAPDLTKLGDYLFRSWPSDAFQGKFAADYIFNMLGKKKVAVVYVNNTWGQGVSKTFMDSFTKLGGTIVYSEAIPQETKDLKTTLTKVKAAEPDLIYYPMYPENGIIGLKQMKQLGMSFPVFSAETMETAEVLATPEAQGILYSLPAFGNPDDFKARVKAATGKDSSTFTSIGYDAVKIFAEVIEKAGTGNTDIKNALGSLSYKGVSVSTIAFDAERNLIQAPYQVKIIKGGEAVPYSN